MPPTALDKWLKKATPDDTGLTRPPATRVSDRCGGLVDEQ
jgi:hypothetical protein